MKNLLLYTALVCGAIACNSEEKAKYQKDIDYDDVSLDSIRIIRKQIDADNKTKRISQIIESKVKESGFNGNVLIAQRGIVLYKKSFGYANFKTLDTLHADSKFQLASLSKTFTAVAIMKMAEDGLFSLENTVKDIFPEFPYEGVTIRSLLCHRSGLPNYIYAFDQATRTDTVGVLDNTKLMQWFQIYKPAVYNQPDHFYSYNNTNFAILAAIVEKMSKQSFAQYCREKIFVPLGMLNTHVVTSQDPTLQANKTIGYEGQREIPFDRFDHITGDKGVYSTTSDLYKWYKSLTKNKYLGAESTYQMFQPRSFEYPGFRNYGYGFRLWLDKNLKPEFIYHTGWWKGYNTIMWFDPKDQFVIIILCNKLNRSVYNIKELVEVLKKGNSTLEDDVTEGTDGGGH